MRSLLALLLASSALFGQAVDPQQKYRWAVMLTEPPLAAAESSSASDLKSRNSARMAAAATRVAASQDRVRAALAQRQIPILGSTDLLINAIYVEATAAEAAQLAELPGVQDVARLRRYQKATNRAIDLINAPRGWNLVNGESGAGAGMKIAILDTGIDHTHPVFQDPSLTMPAGFPRCVASDCDFTSNKVVAARSYVNSLVTQSASAPRADDLSPRDRDGHGTAAASVAAARRTQGPAATVVGVAPRAHLGNYKVFGTPGIHFGTNEEVLITALSDAFRDGMDVASLSLGRIADFGPYDVRGNGAPADAFAAAVSQAAIRGMVVVVSAGNGADVGINAPALQTIDSPATATEAIAVGATTNSHEFFSSLRLDGDVPSTLRRVNALFGDGPRPGGPFTAPIRDVARLDNNGEACTALTRGSLTGAIALIRRGGCPFFDKVANAQRAGASAVIIYQQTAGNNFIFPMTGLETTGIPAVMIGNTAGQSLLTLLGSRDNNYPATLDPALTEQDAPADEVAFFSGRGPAIGELTVKPEVVAPGTDIYMATQSFEPAGEFFDASRYINAQGTSFSAPMVAGAVALVKQRNPNLPWTQLRSLVINTANPANLIDPIYNGPPASVLSVGAGKLNVEASLRSNVTAEPATLSFWNSRTGQLTTTPQQGGQTGLQLTNIGSATVTLTLTIQPRNRTGTDGLSLSTNRVTLNGGQSVRIPVALNLNQIPSTGGIYEGVIRVEGGSVPLRVPYVYLVRDNRPADIYPIYGADFQSLTNSRPAGGLIGFKVVDQWGFPVASLPVQWRVTAGGGRLVTQGFDELTDRLGIAAAQVEAGPQIGYQEFQATAGGLVQTFAGRALSQPSVFSGGIVNAASNQPGSGIAPGSYISIYGRDLAGATRFLTSTTLPLTLSQVSVTFELPTQRVYLPGRLSFVSEGQVNVQVPWEVAGAASVNVYLHFGLFTAAGVQLPVRNHAPAAFEYTEAATDRAWVAALDARNVLIGSNNRARRGEVIQIYANGLGPVSNRPPSGEPSPSNPVATTIDLPTVTIGGRPVAVQFSGLSPGSIGLYQINVVVPPELPAGTSQQIVISVGGLASKGVNIPIE